MYDTCLSSKIWCSEVWKRPFYCLLKPILSAIEVSKPIDDDHLSLEKGIRMYDGLSKADVLVVAPVIIMCCIW